MELDADTSESTLSLRGGDPSSEEDVEDEEVDEEGEEECADTGGGGPVGEGDVTTAAGRGRGGGRGQVGNHPAPRGRGRGKGRKAGRSAGDPDADKGGCASVSGGGAPGRTAAEAKRTVKRKCPWCAKVLPDDEFNFPARQTFCSAPLLEMPGVRSKAASSGGGGGVKEKPAMVCAQKALKDMPPRKLFKKPAMAPAGFDLSARTSDTLPKKLLKMMLKRMEPEMRAEVEKALTSRQWTCGSACSGTGMAEIGLHTIFEAAGVSAKVQYLCEKVKFKRDFIGNIVLPNLMKGSDSDSACVFVEMHDLADGAAACSTHGCKATNARCRVPRSTDVFVCGFSCEDFSKEDGKVSAAQRLQILETEVGTSGSTFKALRRHVAVSRPKIIILENVDEMATDNSPNLEYLWDVMAGLGYGGACAMLLTATYGIPQDRVRAFVVLLECATFACTLSEAQSLATSMLEVTKGLYTRTLPWHKFLFTTDHPSVQAELERKLASASGDLPDTTWQEFHKRYLDSQGMSWRQAMAPTETRSSPWFEVLPSRERGVLGFKISQAKINKVALNGVDTSQRIDRAPRCSNGLICPLTPNSKIWLLAHWGVPKSEEWSERLMTGTEALRFQGFPTEWIASAPEEARPSQPQQSDLAGNAFPINVFMAVMLGVFSNVGNLKEAEATEARDVGAVVTLLTS